MFLEQNKISFTQQKKFQKCRASRVLPFDFEVFHTYGLVALVEYDGEQHYRAVKQFGGEKEFHKRKQRDAIKTQYCADNGIPLIRIPYWDFDNIDAILTEKLLPLLDASSTQKQAS